MSFAADWYETNALAKGFAPPVRYALRGFCNGSLTAAHNARKDRMTATTADTDISALTARELISMMLRRAFPKCTAKRAAAVAGISHRTVEDYLQERSEPGASVLLAWARDHRMRAELQNLLGEIARAERRLEEMSRPPGGANGAGVGASRVLADRHREPARSAAATLRGPP